MNISMSDALAFLQGVAQIVPAVIADVQEAKAAGQATPPELDALIDTLDNRRAADWARVEPELEAAENRE